MLSNIKVFKDIAYLPNLCLTSNLNEDHLEIFQSEFVTVHNQLYLEGSYEKQRS